MQPSSAKAIAWCKPLAQDFQVLLEEHESWTAGGTLTLLPSGAILANMYIFTNLLDHPPNAMRLFKSTDQGKSWRALPPLDYFDGCPFVHEGILYMLIHGTRRKDLLIARSDDEGETWSEPVKLFSGMFWNCPTEAVVQNGYYYRPLGTTGTSANADGTGWWNGVVVVSCDLSGNVLDPQSWRISNTLTYPGTPQAMSPNLRPGDWTEDHWLEPYIVTVRGQMKMIVRTRIDGYSNPYIAGFCEVEDKEGAVTIRFSHFRPFPGAQQRFHIVYDEVTQYYWMAVNLVVDPTNTGGWHETAAKMGYRGAPGNERRILALMYSLDAMQWFQAGCVAMWNNPLRSFHYAAPLLVEEDMLLLVRTSKNAKNQHDSDLMTLHRVKDFRSLALNLHMNFGDEELK